MRVNSPIMSVDVRGSFGPGVVFSKTDGTNWARMRIRTPQVNSDARVNAKRAMSVSSRAWTDLTGGQRALWQTYAAGIIRYNSMGQPYTVQGICEFNGVSALCKLMNVAAPTVPPTGGPPPVFLTVIAEPYWHLAIAFRVRWYAFIDPYKVEIMVSPAKSWPQAYYDNQTVLSAVKPGAPAEYRHNLDIDKKAWGWKVRGLTAEGVAGPWWSGVVRVEG